MLVEVLGTWLTTAGIRVREEKWRKEEDWNMVEKLRKILNI